MKVAIASDDGKGIAQHFGRSRCFIVFDVADGKVIAREVRANAFTAHAKGECDGGHHGNAPHSHADVVEALRDCQAVLCGGMGWRAAEELKANGIQPFVVAEADTADQAIQDFLAGGLPATAPFCRCHH